MGWVVGGRTQRARRGKDAEGAEREDTEGTEREDTEGAEREDMEVTEREDMEVAEREDTETNFFRLDKAIPCSAVPTIGRYVCGGGRGAGLWDYGFVYHYSLSSRSGSIRPSGLEGFSPMRTAPIFR